MKEKFHIAYDQLYDMYPEDSLTLRFGEYSKSRLGSILVREMREFVYGQEYFLQTIKNTIMLFELENKHSLRPDAKYFLLTCFNQMIIKPLVYLSIEKKFELNESDFKQVIEKDITTILNYCNRHKKEMIISGHDVLKSVDNLWGELISTKYELWG